MRSLILKESSYKVSYVIRIPIYGHLYYGRPNMCSFITKNASYKDVLYYRRHYMRPLLLRKILYEVSYKKHIHNIRALIP